MTAISLEFANMGRVVLEVLPSSDNCGMSTLRHMTFYPDTAKDVIKEDMYSEFYSFVTKGKLTPEGIKRGFKMTPWREGVTDYFWHRSYTSPVSYYNARAIFILSGPVDKDELLAKPHTYHTVPFCFHNKLPMFPLCPNPAHSGDRRTGVFAIPVEYQTRKQIAWGA